MANDSTVVGYLTPTLLPIDDQALDRIFHDLLKNLTGLDNTLVRPRFQNTPPSIPAIDVDWLAYGVIDKIDDYSANQIQSTDTETTLIEFQNITILCSAYGNNSNNTYNRIKLGLQVEQNRDVLNSLDIAYTEISNIMNTTTEVNKFYYKRGEFKLYFRRRIKSKYNIESLLSASGTIETSDLAITTF